MRKDGAPTVVASRPAAQAWDGHRLPGPWLTLRALDAAIAMAVTQGTGTVTIRRSHHIACLAAYLKRATDRGLMLLLLCSDPSSASVAPFGGVSPVFTPNPLAAGIPTSGDPILLDVSASYTTNGLTGRLHKNGQKLPHPWLQDAQGNADCGSRGAVRRAERHAAAARRPRCGPQGLRARVAGRGAHRRPHRLRSRRSVGGLGRDGVPAGARPRGVRRTRRVRPPDELAGATPVMPRRRGRAVQAFDCPASAG